jgi:SAM-dependent methyltransferase/uncharacterized protein YbaR (Trm112 family)
VTIDPWFLDSLVCPADHQRLHAGDRELVCGAGHRFPVVDGIPVMLLEGPQTISLADASLRRAMHNEHDPRAPELYLESLGISEDEKRELLQQVQTNFGIDPVVSFLVAATNGLMYRHLIGSLDRYPIPQLLLPDGQFRQLLDVGCSWGRWSLAAAQRGYRVVGIDPSLGAIMAARRVADRLGAACRYVVGDARYLPFADGVFDTVFSYSVIQHFSEHDASTAIREMGRVLRSGGMARVQMPTQFGLRCLYQQARRGFRTPAGFDVRYRTLPHLRRLFAPIGAARVEADGYFGIGLQASDEALMTPLLRRVLRASEWLKALSHRVPALLRIADSVFVDASKPAAPLRNP